MMSPDGMLLRKTFCMIIGLRVRQVTSRLSVSGICASKLSSFTPL